MVVVVSFLRRWVFECRVCQIGKFFSCVSFMGEQKSRVALEPIGEKVNRQIKECALFSVRDALYTTIYM